MPAIPSVLDIARDLIRMDTRNPPGREAECAHYLGGLLEAAGLEVSYRDFAPGRTSLVAVLRGGDGEAERKKPLCFGGHIDVVPLGAKEWSVDPFGAEIVDGRLYGRGSTDMKSGVAAFVHAAMKLAADGSAGRCRHRAGGLRRRGDRLRGLVPSGEGGCARRNGRHRHRRAHRELPHPRPQGRALAQGGDRRRHRPWLDAGAGRERHLQGGAGGDEARGFRFQREAARIARPLDPQCRHDGGRPQSQLGAGPRRLHRRYPHPAGAGP